MVDRDLVGRCKRWVEECAQIDQPTQENPLPRGYIRTDQNAQRNTLISNIMQISRRKYGIYTLGEIVLCSVLALGGIIYGGIKVYQQETFDQYNTIRATEVINRDAKQ